jgi:hypothetical protein
MDERDYTSLCVSPRRKRASLSKSTPTLIGRAHKLRDTTSRDRAVGVRDNANGGNRVHARHQRRELVGGNGLEHVVQTTGIFFERVVRL